MGFEQMRPDTQSQHEGQLLSKNKSDTRMHSQNKLEDSANKPRVREGSGSFTSGYNSDSQGGDQPAEDTPFLIGAFGIQLHKAEEGQQDQLMDS